MAKGKPADLPGADLLFGSHSGKKAETAVSESPVEATRNTDSKKEGLSIRLVPTEETEPVKFTFYFSPRLLEDLEVAKFRLRMEKRLKVSKSDIVNAALQYALKDISFLERLVEGKVG